MRPWLKQRTRAPSNTAGRFRLTRGTARAQESTTLVDLYESAASLIRAERDEPGLVGPVKLTKAKREHGILRAELMKRGYDAEALDYDPKEAMREAQSSLESAAV